MARSRKPAWWLAAGVLTASTPLAWADIHVGVTLSLTAPAASLGIPARNAVNLLPRDVGGEKIRYTVLGDASDPAGYDTRAVALVRIQGGEWKYLK